jgi:aryl-alcohol dehydrogenase-like predicted oxidoreductase
VCRPDPKVPIETVMATLKELHAAGKIRYVGLSEMTADELRRAHAVHPVSAIQIEWSLQTRGFAADVVPTARELGVGIVAYSPLGRGLLTGAVASKGDLDAADWRHKNPRFAEETLAHNAAAGARLASIGARFGASAAQVALAWVHAQGADVVPIPGTKSSKRLRENAAAYELSKRLTAADLEEISAAVPEAAGARY